jgi:hypothetical protein
MLPWGDAMLQGKGWEVNKICVRGSKPSKVSRGHITDRLGWGVVGCGGVGYGWAGWFGAGWCGMRWCGGLGGWGGGVVILVATVLLSLYQEVMAKAKDPMNTAEGVVLGEIQFKTQTVT